MSVPMPDTCIRDRWRPRPQGCFQTPRRQRHRRRPEPQGIFRRRCPVETVASEHRSGISVLMRGGREPLRRKMSLLPGGMSTGRTPEVQLPFLQCLQGASAAHHGAATEELYEKASDASRRWFPPPVKLSHRGEHGPSPLLSLGSAVKIDADGGAPQNLDIAAMIRTRARESTGMWRRPMITAMMTARNGAEAGRVLKYANWVMYRTAAARGIRVGDIL